MKALVQKIPIKDIKVVGKHRPLVEKKLPVITDSLDKIGLKTPITVRKAKKGIIWRNKTITHVRHLL